MKNEKTVAVIMSVYKNDKVSYVKQAVESILQQTYSNFDYYIQSDGPVAVEVDEYLYGLTDKRIHIQWRAENKGLARSLNDLLAIVIPAGYEFIARMDADDISDITRFQCQIEYLKEHPDVDCVGCAINEIDENGNDRGKKTYYPCSPEETFRFFSKRNPVAHPTVMMHRSLFEKAGWLYPDDYVRNEDTMLWYKAYLGGAKIANLPDVLFNFRMTDAMFTQRRNGKAFAKSQLEMRKIINKGLGYGVMSYVYAYAMYLLMISPSWILKIAYKVLR